MSLREKGGAQQGELADVDNHGRSSDFTGPQSALPLERIKVEMGFQTAFPPVGQKVDGYGTPMDRLEEVGPGLQSDPTRGKRRRDHGSQADSSAKQAAA